MTFHQWMNEASASLLRRCGMTADCLPDVDYQGLYRTGNTPDEAACFVIRNGAGLNTDGLSDGDYAEMLCRED